MQIKDKKFIAGFSLVEVMVSVSLFAVIMIAVTDVFLRVTATQRETLASVNLQDNLRNAINEISFDARNAILTGGSYFSILTGQLSFRVAAGSEPRLVSLSNGQIILTKGVIQYPLTSSDITVTKLYFNVVGSADPNQTIPTGSPVVTIYIEARGREDQTLQLQTTIYRRIYNP